RRPGSTLEPVPRAGAGGRSSVFERARPARPGTGAAPRRGARPLRLAVGVRIAIAFAAGLASVITPCVLPLVPGYLSAVSAVEAGRLGERGVARRVVVSSLPLFAGFTLVFVALGVGATALAGVVEPRVQREIGGFVLIVVGLALV